MNMFWVCEQILEIWTFFQILKFGNFWTFMEMAEQKLKQKQSFESLYKFQKMWTSVEKEK